jgi:hypothetical protein
LFIPFNEVETVTLPRRHIDPQSRVPGACYIHAKRRDYFVWWAVEPDGAR